MSEKKIGWTTHLGHWWMTLRHRHRHRKSHYHHYHLERLQGLRNDQHHTVNSISPAKTNVCDITHLESLIRGHVGFLNKILGRGNLWFSGLNFPEERERRLLLIISTNTLFLLYTVVPAGTLLLPLSRQMLWLETGREKNTGVNNAVHTQLGMANAGDGGPNVVELDLELSSSSSCLPTPLTWATGSCNDWPTITGQWCLTTINTCQQVCRLCPQSRGPIIRNVSTSQAFHLPLHNKSHYKFHMMYKINSMVHKDNNNNILPLWTTTPTQLWK